MLSKFNYLKCLFTIGAFLLFSVAQAQSKKITGKVSSEEDNKPLSGVNITIKGKTTGTQTDANGTYSIDATASESLIFSFIGYESQTIKIGTSSTYDLSLKVVASKMDEIVVVGYGTQSRRNVTGAIGKLDTKVIETAPRANIGSSLQGTVAGLKVINTSGTPGSSPSILLRGGASINSPGSPLVVVDGIVRSFNDIASDDIASIELLKDAASTAIYGARANNGVILITTKQGKAGKAEVSYKFTQGYNKNRDGYKYMDARDYIYYNRLGNLNSQRSLAQVNSGRGYGLLTDPANLALFDIRAFTGNESLLSKGWDTVGDPYGANPGNASGVIIFKNHGNEVQDLVFRNTNTQDHYINVNGGNDRGKFFASFDYYKEDGIIVGSDYKRYTGNINGSYKIKPKLEVSTGATFSTSSQYGTIGSEINTLYRNLAIWPTMNPWLDSAKTRPNPGNGITDGNPLYWLNKNVRNNEVNRITGNAAVKYDIIKGLYVKLSGNVYLFQNTNEGFTKATQNYSQIFTNPQAFNTTRPAFWAYDKTVQNNSMPS